MYGLGERRLYFSKSSFQPHLLSVKRRCIFHQVFHGTNSSQYPLTNSDVTYLNFFGLRSNSKNLVTKEQQLYRGDKATCNKLFARQGGKGLYFARSGADRETWVPLIEKTYAKLLGDYDSLEGGYSSEDITGYLRPYLVMYNNKVCCISPRSSGLFITIEHF